MLLLLLIHVCYYYFYNSTRDEANVWSRRLAGRRVEVLAATVFESHPSASCEPPRPPRPMAVVEPAAVEAIHIHIKINYAYFESDTVNIDGWICIDVRRVYIRLDSNP